jgi:hypothetical protein
MEIVLTVCLLSQPANCKDERIYGVVQTSDAFRCALESVQYMAQWMNDHPGYQVVKWRCAPPTDQAL